MLARAARSSRPVAAALSLPTRRVLRPSDIGLRAHGQEAEHANAQLALAAEWRASALVGTSPEVHPVFGTLLRDSGYKRLYCASPLTLWAGTLVWDKQRAFRQDRAELIAQAKLRSSASGWPGCISVVELSSKTSGDSTPALGAVVDGQHRLGAAHLLASKGKLSGVLEVRALSHSASARRPTSARPPLPASQRQCVPAQEIMVEVYPAATDQAVTELFTEVRADPCSRAVAAHT